jgi:hypothetical protein
MLVLVLAAAPAVLRAADGPPKWVLVRMGSRPVQDDPNHQLSTQVARLLTSVGEKLEPIVLALGILGLVALLRELVLMRRVEGVFDFGGMPAVESGIYTLRLGRAPPLA